MHGHGGSGHGGGGFGHGGVGGFSHGIGGGSRWRATGPMHSDIRRYGSLRRSPGPFMGGTYGYADYVPWYWGEYSAYDSVNCPTYTLNGRIVSLSVQNSVPGVTAVMFEGNPAIFWYDGYFAGFAAGDAVRYSYRDCGEKRLITMRRI